MKKYQIEYKYGTSISYDYFECEDDPKKKSAEVATINLNKRLSWLFRSIKAPKTAIVREYDINKKQPKRGGLKFKLKLSYTEIKYSNGRVDKDYFYW